MPDLMRLGKPAPGECDGFKPSKCNDTSMRSKSTTAMASVRWWRVVIGSCLDVR